MLQSLRVIAMALEPLGPTACFYLAAAVSDFYLPWADMVNVLLTALARPLQNVS
jgi:phosphopantothenate-cysteine ligase